jgi:hypothetical protein
MKQIVVPIASFDIDTPIAAARPPIRALPHEVSRP